MDLSGELDREELRVILNEVREFKGLETVSDSDFDHMWTAFDIDDSGTIDKDEFRSYVKKYSLQKIPPFESSQAGAQPELKIYQEGAKMERKKSMQ